MSQQSDELTYMFCESMRTGYLNLFSATTVRICYSVSDKVANNTNLFTSSEYFFNHNTNNIRAQYGYSWRKFAKYAATVGWWISLSRYGCVFLCSIT